MIIFVIPYDKQTERWSAAGPQIDDTTLSSALDAIVQSGADISVFDGASRFDYTTKLWFRGQRGQATIATFDDDHERTGYFFDESRVDEPDIDLAGDNWPASIVANDTETMLQILTDFVEGRDLTRHPYWDPED